MSTDAFSLLAKPIQRILWQMKWESLRPIQVDAIRGVLTTGDDYIIAASTASGKTEAAFLPILSRIFEDPGTSIRALYVGPLKALINDQFSRLERLCEHAEIPVHRWHGDVSASQKKKLIDKPGGVLLITPESLESLFINRSNALNRVLEDLEFIVIDEIHAFVGSERGTHLSSLLMRLRQRIAKLPRYVALSATLGGPEKYASWLRPRGVNRVRIIQDEQDQREVRYGIYGYLQPQTEDEDENRAKMITVAPDMVEDVFNAFRGKKNLIFANNKASVEVLADSLNECCNRYNLPKEFLVHHGSLSKALREQVEDQMRTSQRPATVICSPTLELGIDIGNVRAVGQIGVPWSVSALVQRLGRSGRREGEAARMRVYIHDKAPTARSDLCDWLFLDLMQAIAMTELMLGKWVEPPTSGELDLSTFVQQILSVLPETGGIRADKLYERLVARGAFENVDKDVFSETLRSLASNDLLEQMPQGDLILGLEGQRIVESFDIYSAFQTSEEYRVDHGGQPIGHLPAKALPAVGDHILLAARRWEIVAVEADRKLIAVHPARGRKPPRFLGSSGELHARIREAMREVMIGTSQYKYLNDGAQIMLARARKAAFEAGLQQSAFVQRNDHSCYWFTWTGTREQRTLALMLTEAGVSVTDGGVCLHLGCSLSDAKSAICKLHRCPPKLGLLAASLREKRLKKFDWYLTEELLTRALSTYALDHVGAVEVLRRTVETHISE